MNRSWYVSDFETTSYSFYLKYNYTRVWLWATCDSDAKITKIGTDISEFIDYCRTLEGSIIYFHNLKFDGNFILDYLLNHGYEYKEDLKVRDGRGFTCLIGDQGEFYSIKVNFSKGHQIQFNDSLKLLPFKVETIAKDFKLPILKEHINYDDYSVTPKTIEYISHDVQVVAMGLKIAKENGIDKITVASSAFHNYTGMYEDDLINSAFPDLGTDFLTDWRTAYRGGRCQVNPYFKGKVVHNVYRYDVNSMYPWAMHECSLPYGDPIPIKERGKYKFELYNVNIGFKLKKGHLPSLLRKASIYSDDDSYYIETEGVENIRISSVDLDIVYRNYDVYYIEFVEMYGFLTTTSLFKNYIDKYYGLKCNSYGALRAVYKLLLNALYGKFGSNCEGSHKIPILKDGSISFINSGSEDMKHYYLPVAIAIVSWAHKLIDDLINECGIDNFIYCDTDSVHSLKQLDSRWIDQKALGKLKLEEIEEIAKYVRQKTYAFKGTKENNELDFYRRRDDAHIIDKENKIKIVCCGMPENINNETTYLYKDEIFNVFKEGFKADGKLMPMHVPGGVVLRETTFEIS